jgi:hypothetical protein
MSPARFRCATQLMLNAELMLLHDVTARVINYMLTASLKACA